jgi:hypothetical protein
MNHRGIWLMLGLCLLAGAVLYAVGLSLNWSESLLAWLSPVACLLGMIVYGVVSGEGFPPRAPRDPTRSR